MKASRTGNRGPEASATYAKEAPAKYLGWLSPKARHDGRQASDRSRPNYRTWAADFALIAFFAVVVRIPALSISSSSASSAWDEHVFMLAAREVALGNLPYETLWDHKPLGSTMLIAAAMAVFGQSVEVVHVMGLACVLATGWLLYAITWRVLPDRLTALATAFLYVAFSTRLGGVGLMNEILMAPFTAAGVLLLMKAPEKRGKSELGLTFAAAGLLFGLGVWIKYVPAIPATLVGGFVLMTILLRSNKNILQAVAAGVVFAAGLLLPTLAGAFFFWWVGSLEEFLLANFSYVGRYVEHTEHPLGLLLERARYASLAAVQLWPLMALTAAAFLPWSFRHFAEHSRQWELAAVGLWLASEFVALGFQTRFYEHQFLVIVPPMSVVAAFAVRFYTSRLAVPSKAAGVFALAMAFVATVPLAQHARETTFALFGRDVPREIAKFVTADMAPGDMIYVVNYAPVIYFLTGMPLPTRYALPGHLVGPRMLTDDIVAERRRVLESRPKYVVLHEAWRNNPTVWNAQAIEQVEETLTQHYTPVADWLLHDARGTVRLFVFRG